MKNSNKKTYQELEAIKNAVKQFTKGASIEEINEAAGLEIGLRTLQRRLKKLHELGAVTIVGSTRSTLYKFANPDAADKNESQPKTELIPLSKEGRKILSTVLQPIQHRQPAGYNRKFLEQYRPNKDSYLEVSEMMKLAEIGETTKTDQPAGTYAKEIMNRLLIDLSWNSSRMEGNTYSLLDTERLISFGETSDSKSAAEAQMILNHKDAIEFLVRDVTDIGFNRYTILNLHALLSNNLLPNPAAAGRLRSIEVRIGESTYIPLAIPQLIEELFELMLAKAGQIKNPFEQAFFIMVHLPYLQPFDDVNKRVSRLAANIPLNRHNLAPLSFVDVPNDLYVQGIKGVYELNNTTLLKDVFLWAYERSAARYAVIRQSLGEPDPFRLKYREPIRALMAELVSAATPRKEAAIKIKEAAKQVPKNDQHKFIEAVETELMNLHDGNFARYWISPAQFKKWKEDWRS